MWRLEWEGIISSLAQKPSNAAVFSKCRTHLGVVVSGFRHHPHPRSYAKHAAMRRTPTLTENNTNTQAT